MGYRIAALVALGVSLAAPQAGLAQDDGDQPGYFEIMGTPGAMVVRDRPGGRILNRLDPGTVLHNLGCESFAGRDWCKVEGAEDSTIQGYAARTNLRVTDTPDG